MNDTPEIADKAKAEPIDTRLVRRLADILKATDLTAIEVEQGDLKIRVAREIVVQQAAAAAPVAMAAAPVAASPAPVPAAAPSAPVEAAPPARAAGDLVKSPMVGTAYLQAQPGNPPFIKVGDAVTAGQTLIIVEAMKTMNPIAAPRAGKVVEILVGDAQPIEFGQPLVVLE
jgi:acetyl-CoA carboxylase biotin carboxyl carrier protein